MHLLHPVRARDLINQLAKKLVSSLAISPARRVKARRQKQNLIVTTSVMMTMTISSHESSYIANCTEVEIRILECPDVWQYIHNFCMDISEFCTAIVSA